MKIAILGFAHGHVSMYCDLWRDRPDLDIQVVAGWDHDAARLADAAQKRGIRAYADLNLLLSDSEIEGVVIGAETSMHADVAVAAARAGRKIVLQKPMALTLVQADAIVAAVEETGVPFTLAWQMLLDPQNLRMKRLLDEGASAMRA